MRKTIFLLLIFLSIGLKAQFNLNELNYTGFGTYAFKAFHVLPDESYIGSFDFHSKHPFCDCNAHGGQMAIVRFSKTGDIIWKRCYTKGSQRIVSIMPYKNGTIACMGYSNRELPGEVRSLNFWILIIDTDGKEIDEFFVGNPGVNDRINFATTTPDGGFISGGDVTVLRPDIKEGVEIDMMVIKVSAKGELEWTWQMDKAYWDHIKSIVPLKNGGYLLGGHCGYKLKRKTKNRRGTAWVFKLNRNGKLVWEHNYGNGFYDYLAGMIEKDDGEIVFIGRETSEENTIAANCGRRGFWIVGLNPDGKLLWENFLLNRTTAGDTYATNGTLYPVVNGGFLVGGSDLTNIRTSKLWLARFSSRGKLLYEESIENTECQGVSFIVPFKDKFVAAGWTQGYNTMSGVFDSWIMDFSFKDTYDDMEVKPVKEDSTYSIIAEYSNLKVDKQNDPKLFISYNEPEADEISIYPNPAGEVLNVDLGRDYNAAEIHIFNQGGSLVRTHKEENSSAFQINVSSLKSGLYVIQFNCDQTIKRVKFVKL